MLEEQRTQARASLANIVAYELEDCCNADGCYWGENRRDALNPFFTGGHTSAIFQATVNDVIDTLRRILDDLEDTPKICKEYAWEHERTLRYEETITAIKAKVGLCLDCVQGVGDCEKHTEEAV
jgi:hypothetical protein